MANLILYLLIDILLVRLCFAARRVVLPPTTTTTTTSETPKPWYRTIYSTQVEMVTPTVIAGVTFSAKPPATTNPLQPWISLDANGSPKTIKPEIRKGHTIKASPDYKSYFKTAVTKTWRQEELKAQNMDPDEEHEEVTYLDEDDTYVSLNPVIRCTPERYFKKGSAKDISSEPFCTPRENREWKVGSTYFVTWYTRFFKDDEGTVADRVRVHLSYIHESTADQMHKRSLLPSTFLSSDWLKNVDGLYPITVNEEWLHGGYRGTILISVQPNTISDDEFNPLDSGLVVYIIQGAKVYKNAHHHFLAEGHLTNEAWLYIVLTSPLIVAIALAVMYIFMRFNRRYEDFSSVKHMAINRKRRVLGKFKDMKRFKNMRNSRYDELPQHNKTSKQS